MALSNRSQLAMLADRPGDAIVLGEEAIDVARRLDDRATLAHALTNVGAAHIGGQMCEEGRAELEQAFAIAVEAGHPEHAARALANLAMATQRRDPGDRRIAADLERALAFAREHNLKGALQYVMGARAQFLLLRGLWDEAEADARASLAGGVPRAGSGVGTALLVLGRLQARRGDPEAWRTLDEAWRIARATGGPRCVTAALAARAEHWWLCGEPQRIVAVIGSEPRALTAELAFWLWRASALDRPPPGASGGYAMSITDTWRDAAVAWTRLGFHYEAADAAWEGDAEAMLRALETFDRLGAGAASRRVRRVLRDRGERRVPRGPRPSFRAAPGGLTPRQLKVAPG